jgi:hypothetical protein
VGHGFLDLPAAFRAEPANLGLGIRARLGQAHHHGMEAGAGQFQGRLCFTGGEERTVLSYGPCDQAALAGKVKAD